VPVPSPTLTFGMPVYNEERWLGEAIESLLAQTRGDWVLHISDNASTDGTEDICREAARRDTRIRYERHKQNQGSGFNWTHVLNEATTPFFAWTGGHDRWAPTFVEALLPMLEDPEVITAYPRSQAMDLDGTLGAVYVDDHSNTHIKDPAARFLRIVTELGICNLLYGIWRTDVLRRGEVRPSYGPDTLLITELSFLGHYVQHPDVLFLRRSLRTGETSSQRIARAWSDVTGQEREGMPGLLHAVNAFIRDHIDIVYSAPVELSASRRLWLASRAATTVARRQVVTPTLHETILPALPSFVTSPLRAMWRRRPGSR